MQIDIQVVTRSIRSDDDLFDQRANTAHGFLLRFLISEAFNKLRYGGAISISHAGIDQGRLNVCARQFGLDGITPVDGRIEVGPHLACVEHSGADRFDKLVTLGDHFAEFLFKRASVGAQFFACCGQRPLILFAEDIEQFGVE